jgi:hypothetical protein
METKTKNIGLYIHMVFISSFFFFFFLGCSLSKPRHRGKGKQKSRQWGVEQEEIKAVMREQNYAIKKGPADELSHSLKAKTEEAR